MQCKTLIACLLLAGASTPLLSLAAPPAPDAAPTAATPSGLLDTLTQGVSEIASPGLPGTLCVFGSNAIPIVLGKADRNALLPAVAGAALENGRIIAFCHDGFFAPENLKELDTDRFLANCIAWTAHGKPKPAIGVIRDARLARHLESRGFNVVATDLSALNHVDVLIAEATRFSMADASRISNFIRNGGGFITATTGWGWQQLNPGKDLATELPGNAVLAPAGLMIASGDLRDTGRNGFSVTDTVTPLAHAERAFLAAQDYSDNKVKLSQAELAQVSATLVAAAHILPPNDSLLLPRLRKIQADATIHRLPSKEKPVTAANLFGRLLVTLEGKALKAQPADQAKPHPAAALFPGAVPPEAHRISSRTVTIDTKVPAWHSTGLYAAPGELIQITVPESVAKANLRIRIGAHTDTTWHLSSWSRFPEISRSFKVEFPVTKVSNPFGGLIYVDLPRPLDAGPLEVTISGAVAAPHYIYGTTSTNDWIKTLRHSPAPWGELETKKVIVTLPSSVLRDLEDPAALMEVWDRILDLEAELAGIPANRPRPERIVTDEQISAGYMHSGYPIMTFLDQIRLFSSRESLLRGNWGIFHELGHNHQVSDWTFEGTGEVTCNLFTLFVYEKLCTQRDGNNRHATPEGILRNYAKLTRIGTPDFETWKNDPFVALSMYAQLKNEFGWEPLKKVIAEYRTLSSSERPRSEQEKRDQWMIRYSKAVGKNLAPYFKAWSVPFSDTAIREVSTLPPWMPAGFPPKPVS